MDVAPVVTDPEKEEGVKRPKERCTRTHCGVRVERETENTETVAFTSLEESCVKCNLTSKY